MRELNVYCEIHPFHKVPLITPNVKGVILSGSPASVRDKEAPIIDLSLLRKRVPVLGVCYGAQLMAQKDGGEVIASKHREYGRANITEHSEEDLLFKNVPHDSQVWMSHADTITKVGSHFKITASTKDVKVAGYKIDGESTYGIQFHPEVSHTTDGKLLLRNFLVDICGCAQDWTPAAFADETIAALKKQLADDKVVLGLSGGVDSSVAALLLHKAIGKNLYCIFVDNGLLRKNEFENSARIL